MRKFKAIKAFASFLSGARISKDVVQKCVVFYNLLTKHLYI